MLHTNASRSGFTLIEMLVVVFIIGLLSSVVLVGLGTFRARARDTRRIADLRSVQAMLESYWQKNGEYPASSTWTDLKQDLISAAVGVSAVPNDPLVGSIYFYGISPNRQNYTLGAELEDPNHSALRDDVDNTGSDNYGVDCNDPVYCLKF